VRDRGLGRTPPSQALLTRSRSHLRSRRFRRLGVAAKAVWRALLAASEYGELLPRLSLAAMLSEDPHAAVARLLSRRCAYCARAGEYWCVVRCGAHTT
jgi:hypothetical protein